MARLRLRTAGKQVSGKEANGACKHQGSGRCSRMLAGGVGGSDTFGPDLGDGVLCPGQGFIINLAGAATHFVVGFSALSGNHLLQARDFLLECGDVLADSCSDIIGIGSPVGLLPSMGKKTPNSVIGSEISAADL